MRHVLDELRTEELDGEITIAPMRATSLDEIMANFKKDPDFGAAFYDSGKSGGGASGGGAGGGGAKQIPRSQFDAMSDTAKYEHIRGGGTLSD